MEDIDNLKKFGSEFQSKCIAALLTDKLFVERILDILTPEYFETDSNRWIVNTIMEYFTQYKSQPTLQVFGIKSEEIRSNVLKAAVIEQVKNVYRYHINSPDLKFISEQFLEFCKNQKMKNAINNSADYLKLGEYDKIRRVVDEALKAGMERNLGHEYLVDIEKRMSEMCRDTIKTNWTVIDELLDGGLAKGELGFVVAPAGSGKCVGPNTEIEIEYMETGIPIIGNSGNEYIIWIKPYEKYDLGNGFGNLYGWQIDNILFELEKMKSQLLEQENIIRIVKNIWESDEKRIKRLKELGYDVLIIWELDWNKNKEKCIEEIRKYII